MMSGFDHFAQQVIAFAGTLAYAGKHRQTGISLGNVVDQFLNQYRFAYTGTTEQTDFTTL